MTKAKTDRAAIVANLQNALIAHRNSFTDASANNQKKLDATFAVLLRADALDLMIDAQFDAAKVCKLDIYGLDRLRALMVMMLRGKADLKSGSDQGRYLVSMVKTVVRCIAAQKTTLTEAQMLTSCTGEALDGLRDDMTAEVKMRTVSFDATVKRQAPMTVKVLQACNVVGDFDKVLRCYTLNAETEGFKRVSKVLTA